ncbi:MAG TPA: nucleotidyltransferase family protein, partial [Casimicrobiaceae bacterium]|nr:nucleotidyltransferase family protein [Casimicrobiaceae bacterium]
DILVRRSAVPAALDALARIGYRLDPRLARLPISTLLAVATEVIVRGPDGVPVDLHWELAQRGYPFRFDPELLFGDMRVSRVEGSELPGLLPEALLVFLCMHGAKHAWSRLMWLGDVARLATAGFDEAAAFEFAKRAGCTRPTLLGLLMASDLLGAPVSVSILERARADSAVAGLARSAALRFARPACEHGRYETTFNARLAETTWDRAKHYAAFLAPSEAELTRLSLPASLRALYYPFRIVRLATKYTLKLAG